MSNTSVPNIGDMAPDFELPDIDLKMTRLSEYLGKGTLVLAFFPAAESPVCTTEMCSFRDSLDELQSYESNVIGISVDGPFANKMFVQNRRLSFPILSDYKRDVINRYGIVSEFENILPRVVDHCNIATAERLHCHHATPLIRLPF